MWVRYQKAVIGLIDNGIPIVIVVFVIADTIAIGVQGFRRIERERIGRIRDTVSVIVIVAGIPEPIVVLIILVLVYNQRAVVYCIVYSVRIVVGIARIAPTIRIGIDLVGIDHGPTVVGVVIDLVAVRIDLE